MRDLFDFDDLTNEPEFIDEGVVILRGFARHLDKDLLKQIDEISAQSPFRQMQTPGGYTMSVAMTNCGKFGWITDEHGYRYVATDPMTRLTWPAMPECFLSIAIEAAKAYGFDDYSPDVCLINRYEVGAKMSLHQDADEQDLTYPIVSISLGLPAIFQLGGMNRHDEVMRIPLNHGDVVVWGGVARLRYHGVMPIKAGRLPDDPHYRFNLTFRRAK